MRATKFLRSSSLLFAYPDTTRTYTVKWTGGRADSRVEIDLFYCGPGCGEVRQPAAQPGSTEASGATKS